MTTRFVIYKDDDGNSIAGVVVRGVSGDPSAIVAANTHFQNAGLNVGDFHIQVMHFERDIEVLETKD